MIPINDLKRGMTGEHANDVARLTAEVELSGSYILGNQVENFEKEFAAYIGVGFTSCVASGTDALLLALRSLGVERGSKVLLSPNAGGYATSALIEIGAEPVFVDCDLMGRMDPQSLRSQLEFNQEAACVVVTHLYGLNSNIQEIQALCSSKNVRLLEDCAQSTGAEVAGRKLGSFGEVSTFSFYPTKNLGALGDAGAIVTNSKDLASRHRALRQYGWSSRYSVTVPFGKNSRMDEIQAAVLRLRLPMLDELNQKRRQIWLSFMSAVHGSSWRFIGEDSPGFVAHLGVLVAPVGLRDFAREFLESKGISTSIHYPILDYEQSGWVKLLSGDCSSARDLTLRILTIPLFPELSAEELDKIVSVLSELVLVKPDEL